MYLVLQGEVEGKIFDAFIAVDLHLRGIFIRLEVFDDIREPDRQAIIPGVSSVTSKDQDATRSLMCYTVIHCENWKSNCGNDGWVKFKTGKQAQPQFNVQVIVVFFSLFFQSFLWLSL